MKQFMSISFFLLGFCAISAQNLTTNNPLQSKFDKAIDERVRHFFKDSSKVGLSIGVLKNGQMFKYQYGTMQKGENRLPTNKSLYEIASITKTFTGTLLAKAITEGKITLSDDIRKYLKEPYPNLEFEGKCITIRDLVTHQSGLPRNIPEQAELWQNPNMDSLPYQINRLETGFGRKEWLRDLHKTKLSVKPGNIEFQYSHIGINLIAIALENIYGKSYETLLQAWIFDPLSMSHSKITLTESEAQNLMKGYNHKGKEMPRLLDNLLAAGAIKTNLDDMMQYAAYHLNEKNPVIATAHNAVWSNTEKTFSMGLCWQIFNLKEGKRQLFQDGGAYGFASTIVLFPNKNMAFVLLSNESGPTSQNDLRDIVSGLIENIEE
jgi:serine-type D-Ala-D-Ala carboxypeptidase/endopeptidase